MILQEILEYTRRELEGIKRSHPLAELEKMAREQPPPLDMASALRGGGVKLIAEIKKASPSRGVIRDDFDPMKIAQTYASNGAAAISVLTEPGYFQGSLEHLKRVRDGLGGKYIPVLRKDFIFDDYQVYQSRAYGADCLLLITAALEPQMLGGLLSLSRRLGMRCLVEVHNEAELEVALRSGAGIIGINNRNLNTFVVDMETSRRLKPLIPADRLVVGESGIRNGKDMAKLRDWGVDAALVGEVLMTAPDVAGKMRELLWQR